MVKVSASKDGVVEITKYGGIKVDGTDILGIIASKLITEDSATYSKQFSGSVTITVCDLTIPLIVDVEED